MFLGRLGRVVHNCGRACLHTELYAELHAGNSEKKGHACFQFRTLRGQGPKKWDMPVSSSELYAGRASKGHLLYVIFFLAGMRSDGGQ